MSELEEKHWWFRGRQSIIESVIERFVPLDRHLDILDVGCGTGGNLLFLGKYGTVHGIEMSKHACAIARGKGFTNIYCGCVEDVLSLMPKKKFDLITLIDVLEHIDDDIGALSIVRSILKDGGRLLITVPSHPSLWSSHDVSHHHKRRYKMEELTGKIKVSRLETEYVSYFNAWLFGVVALVRFIKVRFSHSEKGDDLSLPHPLLNSILYGIFSSESRLIGRTKLPMGVSIVVLAGPAQGPA